MQYAPDSAALRRHMVDRQIRTYDVTDHALLERFLAVPREAFVGKAPVALAYSDKSLEVSAGDARRCLLAPLVLARLLQAADVRPTDRVLDIAGGFGYSAAILAGLAASVTALEDAPAFTEGARTAFAGLGLSNVTAVTGDLASAGGLARPFDLVLVNGAVETGIDALAALLPEGGRLMAIERSADDPTGRAGKALRFDKIRDELSPRPLFDTTAHVLAPFARKPEFVF